MIAKFVNKRALLQLVAAVLLLWVIGIAAAWLVLPTHAQSQSEEEVLHRQFAERLSGNNREEAVHVAEQVVQLVQQKHGPDHEAVFSKLEWFAYMFRRHRWNVDA